MQLKQLEAFYWIARLGSFHAAARHLRVAQPSISARVRELERHLGIKLFERVGRAARPTAKGRELLAHAARMIEIAGEIAQRVGERDALAGRVRFGVTSIPAVTWMPRVMRRLAQAYPGIQAEFVVDSSESMRDQLLRGDLDIAFLAGPILDPSLATRLLGRTTMAWVAGAGLSLPGGALGPADLVDVPIITDVRGSFLHGLAIDWFRTGGVEPRCHHACSSLQTRLQLARDGLGLAIAPPTMTARELAEGTLRMVPTSPSLPSLDYVAAIAGGTPGPVVRALLDLALDVLAAEPNLTISVATHQRTAAG
ncbi:MAG: LysR family transcriptional regulator [Alphaproteobacteria bacterium]|nr:LysR family transcriptional regulator [Alphaproteobacteria bacterium]